MPSVRKILAAVLAGRSDANVRFSELRRLLVAVGVRERIKGGHHIFWRDGVAEILNLQPLPGGKAKPYQVKQVRQVISRYGIGI